MFFVMDPLRNAPLFLTALRHVEPARQRRVSVREATELLLTGIARFFGC